MNNVHMGARLARGISSRLARHAILTDLPSGT